jgi:predicted GNAT family N-acyltransferase
METSSCQEAPHGSPLYRAAVDLRDRLLRRPLGLVFTPEELAREVLHRHWVLLDASGAARACLMVVAAAAGTAQIRQMAVDTHLQGTGLGRRLMSEVETTLRREGLKTLFLHARAEAVGFYARLGYELDGPTFSEVGIPHRKMVKHLCPSPVPVEEEG